MFFKISYFGGESPAESQMLSQERIHIRGKNVKTLCFDVIFYLLGFSHFVALCTSWFLFRPWYQTIWKNINLRVWIIEGRNPLGYVRVATTAFEQTHMTFFFANTKLCFVFKSSVNACSCSGLAFEVFTFEINKKFSIVRNDWLNAWMAGFKPESRSCFAMCDSTKSHYVFQLVLSTRCLHAGIIFLASDLSDMCKAQH